MKNRWVALTLICIAVLFSLSLWFSATAIITELRLIWGLTRWTEAWLSASIPIGFVIGSFVSAYFGISDRFNTRKLFAISTLFGSIFNFLLIFIDTASIGIILRIFTGVCLAGVYPPAVLLVSQWFPKQRGAATGILIAALTLGTSLPYLISSLGASLDVRLVLLISSALAFVSAGLVSGLLSDAPVAFNKNPFSISQLKKALKNKPVMLANYGYFGHMWELYAMWTWIPIFLTASIANFSSSTSSWLAMLLSFLTIGVAGGIGSIIGGFIADKIGRSNLTIGAMSISAMCALSIGFTFGKNMWLMTIISLIWGVSVIADSAQFSVAVSEFSEPEYVGTALTFKMSVGFLITIISIQSTLFLQEWLGWQWVFTVLSIGPILGTIAMLKLKKYEKGKYQNERKPI